MKERTALSCLHLDAIEALQKLARARVGKGEAKPVEVRELIEFVSKTVADTPTRDGGFTDYETIGGHLIQAILAKYNVTEKP